MTTAYDDDPSRARDVLPTRTDVELESDVDVEHFKPTGTIFILVLFVATIILLWASVYVILLSRGVTL